LITGTGTIGEKIVAVLGMEPERLLAHPDLGAPSAYPGDEDGYGVAGAVPASAGLGPPAGDVVEGGTLFLSSGFIPEEDPVPGDLPAGRSAFFYDNLGNLIGYYLPASVGGLRTEDLRNPNEERLSSLSTLEPLRIDLRGRCISHLWDMVEANPGEISRDIEALARRGVKGVRNGEFHPLVYVRGDHEVMISEGVVVEPFAVMDATRGPIFLDKAVVIGPHSIIEGPAFIGMGARVMGAHVRGGCSIGRQCRLGGEIEQSIFQGYVNKYHSGFIGHSYIGSWVNFGAQSTNSDLKNNYRPVRVAIRGEEVDTGLAKVGAYIGDHVKTGIGTLMSTGFVCGAGSNLYGGRGVLPKSIPSFVWGDGMRMEEYRWKDFEETARTVMSRRDVVMSERYRGLLRKVFEQTAGERASFLDELT
jgi:UDP-N-acetylglucosamine diphosphorylase/glucosamine-1-phosphate N-acetyltransferase